MVPLSAFADALLTDIESELSRFVSGALGQHLMDDAFAAWVLGPLDGGRSCAAAALEARSHLGAQRTYRDVATMGYAIGAGDTSQDTVSSLASGLEWVAGRQPVIEGRPVEFVQDPVALLGIALGASRLGQARLLQAVAQWIGSFSSLAVEIAQTEAWQGSLVVAALDLVGHPGANAVSSAEHAADVRVALRLKGLLGVIESDADGAAALAALRTARPTSVPHAVLRLASVRWLRQEVPICLPHRPDPPAVAALLRGVPKAFARWTWEERPRTKNSTARKWHVDHEYHVQNLLWFLLAPIFPDLRVEEYLPQVGHRQPRADLGIPSLRLLVEVKFLRRGVSFSDLTEEIASDVSLYLTAASPYGQIVVFVWDESRRTEQYETLRGGLLSLKGVFDAVIVPRPGSLEETA